MITRSASKSCAGVGSPIMFGKMARASASPARVMKLAGCTQRKSPQPPSSLAMKSILGSLGMFLGGDYELIFLFFKKIRHVHEPDSHQIFFETGLDQMFYQYFFIVIGGMRKFLIEFFKGKIAADAAAADKFKIVHHQIRFPSALQTFSPVDERHFGFVFKKMVQDVKSVNRVQTSRPESELFYVHYYIDFRSRFLPDRHGVFYNSNRTDLNYHKPP